MAKREGLGLYKDSPPTDDEHSDGGGEEGSCWFTPRGRGRWRFARVERKQQSNYKWRVPRLTTRSQSAVPGGRAGESSCCCCCGPRWRAGSSDAGATREENQAGSKSLLLQKSSLRFSDGGRVSPALSPLPVRTMSKMERDKERRASVPIWQRRASMSPIKALDLRLRTS